MNELKAKVYQSALTLLNEKNRLLKEERNTMLEGILEETKSSAGDKFETSREMMTQDLMTLEIQIKQSKVDLDEIQRLQAIKETAPTVQEGSMVKLGSDWFMLAVSVGQINVDDQKVYLLSKNSPLGQLILGKKKNDQVNFRGKNQLIEELV
jgi:transcription elongation GreA/GreB family factor